MATRFHKATGTTLALAALLAGCAHPSYRVNSGDGPAGAAVRATLAAQIADPMAGRKPNPPMGLDGNSARAATERYERAQAIPGGTPAASTGMTK